MIKGLSILAYTVTLSAVLGGSLNSIIGKSFDIGVTMASYGTR